MRKLQKAAVVVAMLSSVGVLGAGTASAHGDEGKDAQDKGISVEQNVTCKTHDVNLNIGNGNGNDWYGGLLGNEGDNGTQDFTAGSTNNCSAEAF